MSIFRKILKKIERTPSGAIEKNAAVGQESGQSLAAQISPMVSETSGYKTNDTFGILVRPHRTEKTMSKNGEYTFVVASYANKHQVRSAVAGRFNVVVEDVRILNMPGKERRRGRTIGWKSGFKKAVVVLAQGQTIEVQ